MSVAVERPPTDLQPAGARAGYAAANVEVDCSRLDVMHNQLTEFLDGKLTPAPLDNPRRILELGAGSGAWAIQAAKQFPSAEVVASDFNPLPQRALPPNMRFERADITKPLPFEPASFDVVHIRFVLCHVPDGHTLIPRIAELVAPGGWLLIDDCCMPIRVDGDCPNIRRCIEGYRAYMLANKQQPRLGDDLEGYLHALGGFQNSHVARTNLVLNSVSPDPVHQRLNEGLRESITRFFISPMSPAVHEFGVTPEAQRGFVGELDTTDWKTSMSMVLSWARKAPAGSSN
ncbi:S-adenosyl-L-methionine-dependent methyltransferase [Dentipellis sp. KUC8613]|nr:S-adenosyl-L-methionine-dependent methyltransferase [Dentipellis sp. KUC8613]